MSHHTPTGTHCQNCGTELKGPYCHHCGQHDFNAHQSFGHAVHEALESFFHFEGKFFHGAHALLFRPGKLTREYNAGKRASHMHPLRLYIFVSLLFFIAPNSPTAGTPIISPNLDLDDEPTSATVAQPPKPTSLVSAALAPATTPPPSAQNKPARAPNSKVNLKIDDDPNNELEHFINEKLKHTDKITENFHHYLPRTLLVCVPLFALLSMLVFRRSGYSYLQHLVLSLHLHSFFFLFTLTAGGWQKIAGLFSSGLASVLYAASAVYIVIYAYLTLRNVFGGMRRRGTVLRGIALLGSYSCLLGTAVLGTILTAVWLS